MTKDLTNPSTTTTTRKTNNKAHFRESTFRAQSNVNFNVTGQFTLTYNNSYHLAKIALNMVRRNE